jgi:hypothetical protein
MPSKSSEADIKLAVQTHNANGAIEIYDGLGTVIEKRFLCLDFAYAFVNILRERYWTKKRQTKKKVSSKEFEELMEKLLDDLFCFHKPLRSGYKSIAGHTIGFGDPDGEPKAQEEKAAEPIRTLEGNRQLAWHI